MYKNGETGSLSDAVRQEINNIPHIKTALSDGIVNYSALARKIAPILKEKLQKSLNEESIIVAIKRYAEDMEIHGKGQSYTKIFAGCEITLQDNMNYVHFRKNPHVFAKIEKLFDEQNWKFGEMRALIQETDQIMVMMKEDRLEEVIEELSEEILFIVKNGSMLTLRVPSETVSTYGVLAEITTQVAKRGINIAGLLCTLPDIHILVDENEAERAYSTLKRIIMECKKIDEEKTQKGMAHAVYKK